MGTQIDDAETDLLERGWFAMDSEAGRLRDECESLAHALQLAERAWLGARSRLRDLEAMRDALGDTLARRQAAEKPANEYRPAAVSAA